MAFYEKQKRKQVTSGYKIKMSGLHHGLLGKFEHGVGNRALGMLYGRAMEISA